MDDQPTPTSLVPSQQPSAAPAGTRSFSPVMSAIAAAVIVIVVIGSSLASFRLGQLGGGPELPADFANIELLFDAITDDAVVDPGEEQLVEGAITGLLSTLDDQYAVFYDAQRYAALNSDLDGEFVGIGVTIEERPDGVFVTGVLPGAPADQAGVQPGERIAAVDGVSMEGLTSTEVVGAIAGEEGEEVTITLDMGEQGRRDVTLTRAVLDFPEVASRELDSGFGYVAVRQFSRNVTEQLTTEITTLVAEGVPGLVLDLRGNPGGLLNEAIDVTSLFVADGVVVSVEDRDGRDEREVSGNPIAPDLPLVVLVDGGSASASEIVAAALQNLGRATIVGQTTFGKGTVQTIQDLAFGTGVKFTTAAYFTPSGESIEGVGVEPDIVAGDDPEAQLAAAEQALADAVAEGPGF